MARPARRAAAWARTSRPSSSAAVSDAAVRLDHAGDDLGAFEPLLAGVGQHLERLADARGRAEIDLELAARFRLRLLQQRVWRWAAFGDVSHAASQPGARPSSSSARLSSSTLTRALSDDAKGRRLDMRVNQAGDHILLKSAGFRHAGELEAGRSGRDMGIKAQIRKPSGGQAECRLAGTP